MKKKYTYILFLTIITALYSCKGKITEAKSDNNTLDSSQILNLRFNPMDSLKQGSLILASKLYDSVSYVPLQTSKLSVFTEIDQLEVTDKYFIILDNGTKAILIFNKNGLFHKKIADVSTNSFSVDYLNGQIAFVDNNEAGTLVYYDFDGNYLKKEHLGIQYFSFAILGKEKIGYRSFEKMGIDTNVFRNFSLFSNLIYFKEKSITTGYLPYDTAAVNPKEVANTQKNFYKSGDDLFFIKPFDYYIYKITTDKVTKAFHISLPDDFCVPGDFCFNKKYLNNRRSYIAKHPDMVTLFSDFYNTKGNLFIKFYSTSGSTMDFFHYNFKTKKLVPFSHIASDSVSNFLPLGMHGLASDGKTLFTSVQSSFLIKSRADSKSDWPQLPLVLTNFFTTENNRSNPVIIKLYPKI